MTAYVYEGVQPAIRIKGVVLHRGVPTELFGIAAERAARHSAVRAIREPAEEAPPLPPPAPAPSPVSEAIEAEARPKPAVVRAWARERDIPVPDRGSLKPELYEQYAAEHGG